MSDRQTQRVRVSASPWMRHINAVHTAVEAHDKAGRKWSHGKNRTTGAIVYHATELADLIDEIQAGERDDLGYEMEVDLDGSP